MIFVDTNYWIYYLDSRLPEHKYVKKTMRNAIQSGLMTSYVSILEVGHFLRKLPRLEFQEYMGLIQGLSTLRILELDKETASLALDLLPNLAIKGLGGRDCIIVATMKLVGIREIATHDQAFKTVEGVEVIDDIPRN